VNAVAGGEALAAEAAVGIITLECPMELFVERARRGRR